MEMYQTATHVQTIMIETESAPQFIDITAEVEQAVAESGVTNGIAVIYSKHTTAAIRINEAEPLLLQDMAEFLEQVAPRDGYYRHNDFSIRTANMTDDECPNGHAHCQNLLMGASEAVPIIAGRPQFGRWQRVFLIELDRPRTREVLVQILGD